MFLAVGSTYVEFVQRAFLNKQKGTPQLIFLLANNYFLVNIGRFKITQLAINRRPLDYAIETCLLFLYICFETVARGTETQARRRYTVKALRRVQETGARIGAEFTKLLACSAINTSFLTLMLLYFALMAWNFKISFTYLTLPVNLAVSDNIRQTRSSSALFSGRKVDHLAIEN